MQKGEKYNPEMVIKKGEAKWRTLSYKSGTKAEIKERRDRLQHLGQKQARHCELQYRNNSSFLKTSLESLKTKKMEAQEKK